MTDDFRAAVERRIPYTFTAPSGLVIVVRNVPAYIYEYDDGESETTFSQDVAEKLQSIVTNAVSTAREGEPVTVLSFDDTPLQRDADYEIEFIGPQAVFSGATVQTWRLIFDKLYNAINSSLRGATGNLKGKLALSAYPTVPFLRPASITVGIRASDQHKLFDFDDPNRDAPNQALRLLMDTSLWLDGKRSLPLELQQNVDALDMMLQAVEQLTPPNESVTKIAFVKCDTSLTDNTEFTKEKRERARAKRVELRLNNSEGSRRLDVRGRISAVSMPDPQGTGILRVSDFVSEPEWEPRVPEITFSPALLAVVLENFGKVVRVLAIQTLTTTGKFSRPEALDVSRTDLLEEQSAQRSVQRDPE